MTSVEIVVGLGLVLWACGLAGTAAWVAILAARRRGSPPTSSRRADDVLLVRPCTGAEPNLQRWLDSAAELRDGEGVKVVLAVSSSHDGAYPIALRAVERLHHCGIDASIEITTQVGPNNKAAQLALVTARCGVDRDIVVVADSDVDLTGVSVACLVEPIRKSAEVGAVWAPPVEMPLDATLGDRISSAVLGGSLHAFPVLALLDRRGMVGKLFAVGRASLERTGGFDGLRNVLGEDVELAQRMRSIGRQVVRASFNARSRASGRSVAGVVARFARWLSVVRAQRPAVLLSYPLLFCATLPLLLVAVAFVPSFIAAAGAGLAVAARWFVSRVAARECGLLPPSLLMMAAADLVLLAALASALSTRRIRWRGRELTLVGDGRLVEASSRRPRLVA